MAALHKPAKFDWAARFGITEARAEERKSKLVFAKCAAAATYTVARFCWFSKPRLGGEVDRVRFRPEWAKRTSFPLPISGWTPARGRAAPSPAG